MPRNLVDLPHLHSIRSVLVSRFILHLREAYLGDASGLESSSRFSAMQFAVGNLGAALASSDDKITVGDDPSIISSPRLTYASDPRIIPFISNDPFTEHLGPRTFPSDLGNTQDLGGDSLVYVCYEEDDDIIVVPCLSQ